MDDLYHEHILDHSDSPRNFGQLDSQQVTHTGQAKNVSCGDNLSVQIIADENGKILQIAWEGDGCAISLAAASLLSERAIGTSIQSLQETEFKEILAALGLNSISPARIKCATLFVNALQHIQHVQHP